jgi:hypothetical protein
MLTVTHKKHRYNLCHPLPVGPNLNANKEQILLVSIQASNLQVPHSQCSLRENSKFLQNFRSKNNTLKETFWLIFCLISAIVTGLGFKSKNYFIAAQNCKYIIRENSQKLRQKCKWVLWMRPQNLRWLGIQLSWPPPFKKFRVVDGDHKLTI